MSDPSGFTLPLSVAVVDPICDAEPVVTLGATAARATTARPSRIVLLPARAGVARRETVAARR